MEALNGGRIVTHLFVAVVDVELFRDGSIRGGSLMRIQTGAAAANSKRTTLRESFCRVVAAAASFLQGSMVWAGEYSSLVVVVLVVAAVVVA